MQESTTKMRAGKPVFCRSMLCFVLGNAGCNKYQRNRSEEYFYIHSRLHSREHAPAEHHLAVDDRIPRPLQTHESSPPCRRYASQRPEPGPQLSRLPRPGKPNSILTLEKSCATPVLPHCGH